jgi:hypothetical protein
MLKGTVCFSPGFSVIDPGAVIHVAKPSLAGMKFGVPVSPWASKFSKVE